jgi:hypothetical protein
MVNIETLAGANNVDEILDEIHRRETKFKGYRYVLNRISSGRS